MFRFVHAADVHLDSPLLGLDRYESAPAEAIRQASRRAFENLVQITIDENAAFLLIAGDLYDGDWKDYRTGLFFTQQMARLRDSHIPVFIVAGNHDAQNQLTKKLRPPDNVHFFSARRPETRLLDEYHVAIHGQSFHGRAVTENLAAAFPAAEAGCFNIGLLHTSLDGRSTHDTYAPATVADLVQKGYDYWALGHIHNRLVVSTEPWIVFSGNLQGRHARETGSKGCTLVSVDGVTASVEERFTDVARFVRCDVNVANVTTTSDVLDCVEIALLSEADRSADRLIAARIHLNGATICHDELAAARDHWVEEIRAVASTIASTEVWVERVAFDTTRPLTRAELALRKDAIGYIARALSAADEEIEREALASSLADLRSVLPRELLNGEDGVDFSSPDALSQLADDARDLLIARLSYQGVR